MENASFDLHKEPDRLVVRFKGSWDVARIAPVDKSLGKLRATGQSVAVFQLGEVERMDTAGAWLVFRTMKALEASGLKVSLEGIHQDHQLLIERVACPDTKALPAAVHCNWFIGLLDGVGRAMVHFVTEVAAILGFFGLFLTVSAKTVLMPWRLRLTALVSQMEQVGLNAVPIVSLISFLIGIVLAYMGAQQLERFGAQVFVVNLIEAATLRELGILLTAIVVAGRSGSSFTAQIGSMVVNEEVDAMRSMGLDPMEVLVLPRLLALIIMLPILGFIADMMGLFGGGLMSWAVLDIGPGVFIERLRVVHDPWNMWVGMIKAPFFAVAIGLIGCFCGFQVSGSAESVGRLTTQSVVEAIFTVIVLDAVFAIFFAAVGV